MKAQMYNYSAWIDETDPHTLKMGYDALLQNAGFTILNTVDYHFDPQGYTMLYLLGESHFAIHTFPEHKQSYIELSSCVKQPFDNFMKTT